MSFLTWQRTVRVGEVATSGDCGNDKIRLLSVDPAHGCASLIMERATGKESAPMILDANTDLEVTGEDDPRVQLWHVTRVAPDLVEFKVTERLKNQPAPPVRTLRDDLRALRDALNDLVNDVLVAVFRL